MPVGILSKLYYNQGLYGAPTWIEVDLVGDLKFTFSWNEGEGSARREALQVFEPTNASVMLEGKLRKQYDDTAYVFFRTQHRLRAVLDILMLDGANNVNGSDGFRFDAKLFQFDEDQAMQNVLYKDFTLKPCISSTTRRPKTVLVAGGVPVYTDLTN